MKTAYAGQAGKLAYARVFGGDLSATAPSCVLPDGEKSRAGGLFAVQGGDAQQDRPGPRRRRHRHRQARARQGRPVPLARRRGEAARARARAARRRVYGLAIAAKARKDDVRCRRALAKLVEEDPALAVSHDADTHEMAADRPERRPPAAGAGADEAPLRRRCGYRAAHDALQGDDLRAGHPARPAQEADRRPRPVRRRDRRDQAADRAARASRSASGSPAAWCPGSGSRRSSRACATAWPRGRWASRSSTWR